MLEEEKKTKNSELEKALQNMKNRQKVCPHCGMLLLNGARFCKNCGTDLSKVQ